MDVPNILTVQVGAALQEYLLALPEAAAAAATATHSMAIDK